MRVHLIILLAIDERMTTAELILEWAKLLLQWQVLAAVLALVAMFLWKEGVRGLIQAIAERGGKVTAGPVSGEIAAAAGEGAMPIAEPPQASDNSLDDETQRRILDRLALVFDDLVGRAKVRSAFVEETRRDYANGWTWDFLDGALGASRMSARFCAASLLTTVVREFDPVRLAYLLSRESSSLVRYRLVEALMYWATSSISDDKSRTSVLDAMRDHVEENAIVEEKFDSLIRLLRSDYH